VQDWLKTQPKIFLTELKNLWNLNGCIEVEGGYIEKWY
jgi:hypothetical protein